MSLLDRCEQRFRRFAIPGLTGYIASFQAALWLLALVVPVKPGQGPLFEGFLLMPDKVKQGEVWRLVSFVFLPQGTGLLSIFCIYLFYLMGTALEAHWGTVRYNLFVLIAVLATIATAFLLPNAGPATNVFIGTSVFLAFAFLYPDFVLQIYFLFPIKIKWLALLTWLGYAWVIAYGDWEERAYVLASVCNFLLFFGGDVYRRMRYGQRKMESAFRRVADGNKPFHTCVICGLTDHDEPNEDFRYCSKCDAGTFEYCSQHLRNHEHSSEQITKAQIPMSNE